jgi:hypothetical protein
MSKNRNMGYISPPVTASVSPAAPAARAASISNDISPRMLAIKPWMMVDQQRVPCCVSCALGAAMGIANPSWPPLAPLFHYYVTRFDNLAANSNGSLFLDRAMKTLTKQGICALELHHPPYTVDATIEKPSLEAYTDGLNHRIPKMRNGFFGYTSFSGTSRAVWIKDQLLKKFPVVIGFRLPEGYSDLSTGKFEWQDPENPRAQSNGHCVVVIGFDDSLPAFRILDSQGENSFDRGCWWMGYRVADSYVIEESYCIFKN